MSTDDLLQELLAKRIKEAGYAQLTDLFIRKVAKKGHRMSQDERTRFQKWLMDGATETFRFDDGKADEGKITLVISSREQRRMLGKIRKGHQVDAEQAVAAFLETLPKLLLEDFKSAWPKQAKSQKRDTNRFRRHLERLWGKPLEQLAMLLVLARELGDGILEELNRSPRQKTPSMNEAMVRLHARSCQIAEEVMTLLHAGLADGAIARWRSLHEVSVVLFFIWQRGEYMARRYLDHDVVESFRAALGYDQTCERLGRPPLTEGDWKELRKARDTVLKKYGEDFDEDYGWAAAALKKRRPKFADLQSAVELDHWKSDYKFASHNVHAGSKGISFRLSSPDSDQVISGASDFGLCEPGQNTAISIAQTSTVIVQLAPTLERLAMAKTLGALCEEIGYEFLEAHNRIVESLNDTEVE